MSEVLATAEFSSVIHNNEVCEEIVKWGNKNGYPLTKAKLYNSLGGAYVGFAPGYLIKATRRPPVPGGWDVTVETYDAETRIIPLNVNKETGEAKNIVFGLTGTGYFDMVAYEKYNNGEMSDYIPTDEEIAKSLASLPKVD